MHSSGSCIRRDPATLFPAPRSCLAALCAPLLLTGASLASAQPHEPDEHTLLLLHFDGDLLGVDSEQPEVASGLTFEEGVFSEGVRIDDVDQLDYSTTGEFLPAEGTIELWFQPTWNGSNGLDQCFLHIADGIPDPMLVLKDGADNLRFLMGADDSEAYQAANLSGIQAGEWHHLAITWTIPGSMRTYVDGVEVIAHDSAAQDLIDPLPPGLSIGHRFSSCHVDAVVDELRVSDIQRTAEEIEESYERGGVGTDPPFALAVFYAVPSDIAYSPAVHQRLIEATLDIQAWYQCATTGRTWDLAFPEIVQTYFADEPRQYYLDGNWWGPLLSEMATNGYPVRRPGIVTAVWAHGAGWWAGSAQGCGDLCGIALLGVELFPEFNNPLFSGDDCPGGTGFDAGRCTPEGAFAHEIGHCVGLPHPLDDPDTEPWASHSLMQTHWNYPDYAPQDERPWGFLSLERLSLVASPFMKKDIELDQIYPSCDVVNLPDNGPTPAADFCLEVQGPVIRISNNTSGATSYYWTFGDGGVSNAFEPTHTYQESGTYTVRLSAMGSYAMIDEAFLQVMIVTDIFTDGFESGDTSAWSGTVK